MALDPVGSSYWASGGSTVFAVDIGVNPKTYGLAFGQIYKHLLL
jgi:hypothetical protein